MRTTLALALATAAAAAGCGDRDQPPAPDPEPAATQPAPPPDVLKGVKRKEAAGQRLMERQNRQAERENRKSVQCAQGLRDDC